MTELVFLFITDRTDDVTVVVEITKRNEVLKRVEVPIVSEVNVKRRLSDCFKAKS